MAIRKKDSIGPCTTECEFRNATCKLTCELYQEHRKKQLERYDEKAKTYRMNQAISSTQYNSLIRARRGNNYIRKK